MALQPGATVAPVFEETRSVVAALAGSLGRVDHETLTAEAAGELLELAGEIERLGVGLRFLVADRAAAGRQWQERGHRTPASWLATVAGSAVGEARATIEASGRLARLPGTREALRHGELSPAQLKAVVAAADADPKAEPELLEAAAALTVERLQAYAREVRAAACEPDRERQVALRRRRYLRFWTEPGGMMHFSGAVPADDGAELVAAVRARAAFVADEALAAGVPLESQEALDADALVALATGDVRMATFSGNVGGRTRNSTVVMHVSLDALRRGSLEAGELCEIPGVGSVPLAAVEELLDDATVALAVRREDGAVRVVELGPTVSPWVERALAARDTSCVVPDCFVSLSLRTARWPDEAVGSPCVEEATLAGLAKLCAFHHRQMRDDGFVLGGGHGRWEWRAPP